MKTNLINLLNSQQKSIKVKVKARINDINSQDEYISVTVECDDGLFRGLIINKSDIFPIPEKDDLIQIDSMKYTYDEDFNQRIFIHAKLVERENNSISNYNNTILSEYDLTTNITNTLKNLLNINETLISKIFIVFSADKNHYLLKCLENNELYTLSKESNILEYNFSPKDIIYINNFYFENNNSKRIKFSQITLIEKMTDENLFILLEKQKEINHQYFWGKIIGKDEINKIIRIMDKDKNVYKLEDYKEEICLGQYFIFSNYNIDNNIIKLNNNSFSYFSSQELYFSNKILLNNFSVIHLYFNDFKEDENIYKIIQIDGNSDLNSIHKNDMEIILNIKTIETIYKVRPIKLILKENSLSDGVEFYIKITLGLFNNASLFINYKDENKNAYSYEYLYMFLNETNISEKYKMITINSNPVKITKFDNFCSKNRIKFNIVNIPFQNEINEVPQKKENILDDKINSLSVCEIFENDLNFNIYGIFNMKEILKNMHFLFNKNLILNNYYNKYGNIYNFFKNLNNDNEAINLVEKYNNEKLDQNFVNSFKCINIGEEITNSQLKTRMGILIIDSINTKKSNTNKLEAISRIRYIVNRMENIKNEYSNIQKLKIFSYFIKKMVINEGSTKLIEISKLNHDSHSPYYLAIKFNLEEIDKLDEYCKLFEGYLQMDSQILFNYKLNHYSYSLSIEPLFMLKHHLKSNYEGFLFIERNNDNIISSTENYLNVIIINELNLFERSKYTDTTYIENEDDSKHHAFSISMILRHESNSHEKKNLKNQSIFSPVYYCLNGKEKEYIYKDNKVEDGIIIENMIIENQTIINSLIKDFIYGELLDINLFIQKDFSLFLKKMYQIRENNKIYLQNMEGKLKSSDSSKQNKKEIENKEDNDYRIIIKAMKTGILKFGDQSYSIEMIEKMVELAKDKGHIEQIPKIVMSLYEAINASKEQKK